MREMSGRPHAPLLAGLVALGLESEVQADAVRRWAEHVLPDGVAAAAALGRRHFSLAGCRCDHPPRFDGTGLEVMRARGEPVVDRLEHLSADRIIRRLRFPGANNRGRIGDECLVGPSVDPSSPRPWAAWTGDVAGEDLVDPRARDRRHIEHGEAGAIVLEPQTVLGSPDGL